MYRASWADLFEREDAAKIQRIEARNQPRLRSAKLSRAGGVAVAASPRP